jgi:hypothetical protein
MLAGAALKVDEVQGKAVMSYMDIGRQDGKLLVGGKRLGNKVRARARHSLQSRVDSLNNNEL